MRGRRYSVSPEALQDIVDAAEWYEIQRSGLGKTFLQSIKALLVRAAKAPQQFPAVRPGIRRALTRTFPYAVYFEQQPGSIRVVAVLHQRKDRSARIEEDEPS